MLDYFEDIKMAAVDCANLVIESFLPIEPQWQSEQAELLQQLRSSISMGWSEQSAAPLKEMANIEIDLSKYLFNDTQVFIKTIVQVYMDEPCTRVSLNRFISKVNRSLPFLLMNDYRLATAT